MSRILKPDGLRGIAVTELSCELMLYIGRATAQVISRSCQHPPVFYVAHDPRRSADLLEAALCAGICSGGGMVTKLGVLPSPATALLLSKEQADAGFILTGGSATYEYTGLLMLTKEGFPMSEEQLASIEAMMPGGMPMPPKSHRSCGVISQDDGAAERYLQMLHELTDVPTEPLHMKIAVDCANGSLSAMAERIFQSFGAEVLVRSIAPSGVNINKDCGVTDVQNLLDFVTRKQCQAGFAFDGDGARCIAVDEKGELLDGDRLLAVFLSDALERGKLAAQGVAATVMSNMGFLRYAKEKGVSVHTTQPTPRFVHERVRSAGLSLGGERGGHFFFADMPASDGIVTALRLLYIMQRTKKSLSELGTEMVHDPQVLLNVKIASCWREIWKNDIPLTEKIAAYEKELGADGRILVRELPKDAVIQVLLEGRDFRRINTIAMEIADMIRQRTAFVPAQS